jgi:hypothetical protein
MKSILAALALAFGALTFQSCEEYPNGLPVAITTAAITAVATVATITTVATTMGATTGAVVTALL